MWAALVGSEVLKGGGGGVVLGDAEREAANDEGKGRATAAGPLFLAEEHSPFRPWIGATR
jgi:hypothetical protein